MHLRFTPRAIWLSACALLLLLVLAFVVSADNAITRGDVTIVEWAAGERTSFVGDVAEGVSWLGNILVLGVLTIAAGIASAVRRGRHALTLLPFAALAAAAILDPLAKLAVGRPRPPAELAEVIESATGFPSGHSAQAAAAWIGIALLIAASTRRPTRWLVVGIAVAFVVGVSRVVLGVHSPTDILGGWALGLACVLLTHFAILRSAPDHALGRQEQPGLETMPGSADPVSRHPVTDTGRRTTKAPHERGRTDVIGSRDRDL